jgi:hypothetical protein
VIVADAGILQALDALHQAARRAEFDKFALILAMLETFLAAPGPMTEPELAQIRRRALATQACLGAAAQGIRSARQRMAEIESARRLVTYDKRGVRRDHEGFGTSTRI